MTTTITHCQQLDRQDPLRSLRDQFTLPQGVIYLDGNSLGALPKTAATRVAEVVNQEWGTGLIRSWNTAGWVSQPQRLGDKIARLIGAKDSEVVVTDSTSVNLYKVISAALTTAGHDAPKRKLVLSERSNFPTDLYIAQGLCAAHGYQLQLIEASELMAALTSNTSADVAVVMLTHVNYRTGAMFDMAAVTRAAHHAGALAVWDLAHSAGAVPVDLNGAGADFAVGCGYKFLNGGPGAPAFVWVNSKHAARTDLDVHQPLTGWFGHQAPFAFTTDYTPAPGITRYLCGTPPILSMAALDCGLDTVLAAEPFGGMAALYAKSLALGDMFMALVQERCAGYGLQVVTPLAHSQRGSQVSLAFDASGAAPTPRAFAVIQALTARGVIGDFRAGGPAANPAHSPSADLLRFGLTPLYLGFEDLWTAVEHLRQVLETQEWQRAEFNQKHAVT